MRGQAVVGPGMGPLPGGQQVAKLAVVCLRLSNDQVLADGVHENYLVRLIRRKSLDAKFLLDELDELFRGAILGQ